MFSHQLAAGQSIKLYLSRKIDDPAGSYARQVQRERRIHVGGPSEAPQVDAEAAGTAA